LYTFSFIFQIHNRVDTIEQLLIPFIDAINDGLNAQIIINDDGSTDGTQQKIMGLVDSKLQNHDSCNILFTKDIFEIEHDWRCMRLSEAEIMVFMQDDDYYETMEFAHRAKALMDKYPNVGFLSPKHGVNLDKSGNWITYSFCNSTDGKILPPVLNEDGLMLVQMIDKAPFIVRSDSYYSLGGIDRNYKVGAYTEHDLCIRAYNNNIDVGIYSTSGYHFRYWEAGSLRPGSKITSHHSQNRARFYQIHGHTLSKLGK